MAFRLYYVGVLLRIALPNECRAVCAQNLHNLGESTEHPMEPLEMGRQDQPGMSVEEKHWVQAR